MVAMIVVAGMCNMAATEAMMFKHLGSYLKSLTFASEKCHGQQLLLLCTSDACSCACIQAVGADRLCLTLVCVLQGEGSEL